MVKIFPEFSKERTLETGSGCCIDGNLAEFLSSKLELKVYYFLFFAIRGTIMEITTVLNLFYVIPAIFDLEVYFLSAMLPFY